MKSFLKIVTLGIMLCGVSANAKASERYEFENASELQDFTHSGGASSGWTWSSTGGAGGTGGLLGNTTNNASFYIQNRSFAGSTESFTLAASFQWEQPVYGTGHGFVIGATGATTSPIAQNAPGTPLFYFGIGRVGTDNTARLIGNWANATEALVWQSGTNLTMTVGGWYHVSGGITWSEANQTYTIAITLYSMSSEGVLTQLVSDTLVTGNLSALNLDPSLHAFFGSQATVSGRGTRAIDSFTTPVPEPGSMVTVASGLMLLYGSRRMKRSLK